MPPGISRLRPFGVEQSGIAQRMEQLEETKETKKATGAYTGTDPLTELKNIGTAFRFFAKLANTKVMEVQAMWYKLEGTDKGFKLAYSANDSDRKNEDVWKAVGEGVVLLDAFAKSKAEGSKQHPDRSMAEALKWHDKEAYKAFKIAGGAPGLCHAEQNLLAWIAPQLTKTSVFYIAGSKPPCKQCAIQLNGYQGRLMEAGYTKMFGYVADKGQNVEANEAGPQIDYTKLAIP